LVKPTNQNNKKKPYYLLIQSKTNKNPILKQREKETLPEIRRKDNKNRKKGVSGLLLLLRILPHL